MKKIILLTLAGFILGAVSAGANMSQITAYKTGLPNADKPKCIGCHVDKMPKKDDGAHELNDYGKVVVAAAKKAGLDKPTADTYKASGSIEDFAKNAAVTK